MATYDERGRLEEEEGEGEGTVEDPQGVLEGNPKPRRRIARKAVKAAPPPPPEPEEEEEPVIAAKVGVGEVVSETIPSPPPAVRAEKYVKPSELVSKSVFDRWPAVIEHLRRSGRDAGDCTVSVKRTIINNFNQEPLELMPFDGALVAGTSMVPPGDAIVNFITDAYHTTCPTPAKYTLTFRYKVRPQNENNPYICQAELSLASAAEIAMHRRAASEAYKRAASEAAMAPPQAMPSAPYPQAPQQTGGSFQAAPQAPLAQQLAGLLGMGGAPQAAPLSVYGSSSEPDPTQLTILELLKSLVMQAATPKPAPEVPKAPTFEQELQKMGMFIKLMRELNPPQPVVTPPPAAQAPAPTQAPKDPWQEALKFLRGQVEMKKELKKLGLAGNDEEEKEETPEGPEKPFEVLETGGMRIPYKEGMNVVSMEFLQNYALLNPDVVMKVMGTLLEKAPALGAALAQQLGGAVGMGAPPPSAPNPTPRPLPPSPPSPAPTPAVAPREKVPVPAPVPAPNPAPVPQAVAAPKPGFRPAV